MPRRQSDSGRGTASSAAANPDHARPAYLTSNPWQARRGRYEETAVSDGLPANRCGEAA
ncbi:hypothetical protein [Kingella potus]|uniref:hypothetical protein n=1 Tax=Kingella potus TaxID=265175 RepID=UPI001FD54F02|nr:hypothetical protein [Kingella potus]UOP00564.1 hypothetical protein LVJ84_12100 [Kingella potus]UOP01982.1 hypothetical protein LVJ84_14505 [Kingella potus]